MGAKWDWQRHKVICECYKGAKTSLKSEPYRMAIHILQATGIDKN